LVVFVLLIVVCDGRALVRGAVSQQPPPGTVRVAGIVLKWLRTDKQANFQRAQAMIREAAAAGAQIVCTTESFLDGYAIRDKSIPLDQFRALGEPIPDGKYFQQLCRLAGELHIHLVAGMLQREGDQLYNTAVVIGPDGQLIHTYHKQKLGHEAVRISAGSDSSVAETPLGRVGVMICADRTNPQIVKRFCARGAQLLLCPSGGMFGPRINDPIVQARSLENKNMWCLSIRRSFWSPGPTVRLLRAPCWAISWRFRPARSARRRTRVASS